MTETTENERPDPNLFEHEFNVLIKKTEGKYEAGDDGGVLNVHVDLVVLDRDLGPILATIQGRDPAGALIWAEESEACNAKRTTFDRDYSDHQAKLRVGTRIKARIPNVTLNAFAINHDRTELTLKLHGMNVTGEVIGQVSELLGGRAYLTLARGEHWQSQEELALEAGDGDADAQQEIPE